MNKTDSYACKKNFVVAMFLLTLLMGPSLLEAAIQAALARDNYAAQISNALSRNIRGEYNEALEYANEALKAGVPDDTGRSDRLKKDPDNHEMLDMRATIESIQRDYNSAMADLTQALKTTEISLYYTHRADVYAKMGKKDLAAQDLQLAKKKDSFSMFP